MSARPATTYAVAGERVDRERFADELAREDNRVRVERALVNYQLRKRAS